MFRQVSFVAVLPRAQHHSLNGRLRTPRSTQVLSSRSLGAVSITGMLLVRLVSPRARAGCSLLPCRFLPYAAGRDCVGQEGGGGGMRGSVGVLHCQPSSMTFAVVVVPLPSATCPRVGGALSTSNDPGITASQACRHVEHPRGPIFFTAGTARGPASPRGVSPNPEHLKRVRK